MGDSALRTAQRMECLQRGQRGTYVHTASSSLRSTLRAGCLFNNDLISGTGGGEGVRSCLEAICIQHELKVENPSAKTRSSKMLSRDDRLQQQQSIALPHHNVETFDFSDRIALIQFVIIKRWCSYSAIKCLFG